MAFGCHFVQAGLTKHYYNGVENWYVQSNIDELLLRFHGWPGTVVSAT